MFEPDQMVEVRYSLSREQEQGDRSSWPWLPGSIIERCGDEWYVCVEDDRLAVREGWEPAAPRQPLRQPVVSMLLPGRLGAATVSVTRRPNNESPEERECASSPVGRAGLRLCAPVAVLRSCTALVPP